MNLNLKLKGDAETCDYCNRPFRRTLSGAMMRYKRLGQNADSPVFCSDRCLLAYIEATEPRTIARPTTTSMESQMATHHTNRLTLLCVLFTIAFWTLLALAAGAFAEEKKPAELVIGSTVISRVYICDTVEQARQILNAHQANGIQAAREVANSLQAIKNEKGEGLCGDASGKVLIKKVHYIVELPWPDGLMATTIVEVELMGITYFAITKNINFIEPKPVGFTT